MLVKDHIDILMLSETKAGSSFTHTRFSIEGYTRRLNLLKVKLDGGRNCGEFILFIMEGLPSTLVSSKFNS